MTRKRKPIPLQSPQQQPLTWQDYRKADRVNWSTLRYMVQSPLAYRAALEGQQQPETDAMIKGRLIHAATLDPDSLMREFIVWQNGRRAGAEWESFKALAGQRTIVRDDDYTEALAIRDAVRRHPAASHLLSKPGPREYSILWTHPRTGVECKSRLDLLCDNGPIVDLKSTRDPSPRAFAASAARLLYHAQAAFYCDAVSATGDGPRQFKIIAAQTVAPFDVVVYALSEADMQEGRIVYEAALDRLLECRKACAWPGQAPEEVELKMPAWIRSEDDDLELTFGGEPVMVYK